MYVSYTVLGILSSGYCDDSKEDCSGRLCNSWADYFHDADNCRSLGGVDKYTMQWLSFLPFGFSSFYKGKIFDGLFECFLGISALISSIIICCCSNSNIKSECQIMSIALISSLMSAAILIMGLVKIILTFTDNNVSNLAAFLECIMIIIISICSCRLCSCDIVTSNGNTCIFGAIHLALSVGIVEVFKHIVMVAIDEELDANGCSFVK